MKYLDFLDPASPSVPVPRSDLDVIDASLARKLARYLEGGQHLIATRHRAPDALNPEDPTPLVSLTTRSDGTYVWSEAVAYYVRKYRLSPGEEFIQHCRELRFKPPRLGDDEVSRIIAELRDPRSGSQS